MTYRTIILPRAERDAQVIFDFLAHKSPNGALRWWAAFQEAVSELLRGPKFFGYAPENQWSSYELR